MNLAISDWIRINHESATQNGVSLPASGETSGNTDPVAFYHQLQHNYPKFFKMDVLCKWAWLGAEYLLSSEQGSLYEGFEKSKIAVVLMTSHGCLDVDKKYMQSIATIPSPALFVYTLPNIMLGEICIRHGFKGEQLSLVSDAFDSIELQFWVNDLLNNRGMEACLCGWVDGTADIQDVCMFWVTKGKDGVSFSAADMQQVYKS